MTPSGDFLMVYNNAGFRCLRRSTDGGNTWGAEIQQFSGLPGDPTLWVTPNGTSLLVEFGKINLSSQTGAAWSVSQDSGLTWAPFQWFDNPVTTTFFVSSYLNVGNSAYGLGYQASVLNDGSNDANWWSSSNNAQSWTKVSTIRQPGDAGISESTAVQTGPSTIFVVSRADDNVHTYAHISNNLGVTWSSQIDITSQVGVVQDPCLYSMGNGTIVLLGRDFGGANPFVAHFSYDNANTFSGRLVLDTPSGGPDALSYSASVVLPGNTLLTAYGTNVGAGAGQINLLNIHVG
jgi:hypothetical protein